MQESRYEREPGYAERYRDRRFRTGTGAATDRRERRALARLLATTDWPDGPWLDVPCGAGRLTDELPAGAVQVDRDPQMVLAAAATADATRGRLCASALQLPFRDGSFAGVLCMRLLQHIATPVERITILRELRRVSRGPIVASFFDSCSLQHLRRRARGLRGKRRSGRHAVSRAAIRAELGEAGLRCLAMRGLRRYFAEQTLVLCAPETDR